MKVRIKRAGLIPRYLTKGKLYDARVIESRGDDKLFEIKDDDGQYIVCVLSRCVFLKGGSWEIVD